MNEDAGRTLNTAIDTAMLLAAGLGTRMRPLTDTVPKPLVKVDGKAMIDYVLDALDASGITRVVVNVHYRADQIEAHIEHRDRPEIVISDERSGLLDSGGGVKKALPHLGDKPFLSLNSDAIWIDGPRPNILRMIDAFDADTMDILLLVASTSYAVGWGNKGDFSMDQHGRLRRPKPGEVTPFAYAGIAILKPELFVDTPDIFSLNLLFNRAIERERLFGLRMEGLWMHVGTPEAVDEASHRMRASVL
ncbi:MAG: nucleotidyltransferase family protein [Beijerinckiaceae bacterium]|nr:nucleotidyltransferase family protein [Beijerinckiaceae bacterium]